MGVGLLIHVVVPDLLEIYSMTDLPSLRDHLISVETTEKRLAVYKQALNDRIKELESSGEAGHA